MIDYSDYSFQYYNLLIPELLKKYLDKTSYKTILDCGCGDGSLLYSLKKNGYFEGKSISAIDLSPKSINLVHKIDKRIKAYVDNVEKIRKIPKSSIDFLISTTVIEHVDDKKMLDSVYRVLKKNGIAYITTVFKKPYGWYFYRREGKWVMDVTHLREYTKDEELMKLIDRNKYKILESKKSLMWFPVIDFFLRKMLISNRELFVNNIFFTLIRKIRIPIIGYYDWEIVLKKK